MPAKHRFVIAVSLTLLLLASVTQAANLRVNCSHKSEDQFSTINAALRQLRASEPNTITVSGTCIENVVINSLDRLVVNGINGASITDASNGSLDVIDITDSQRVTISGFTINGGSSGVVCSDASLCRFSGNTIQGSANYGLVVAEARATLNGDTLQNHGGRGLSIVDGGSVDASGITVQGNFDGVVLNSSGYLVAGNSVIRDNQRFGVLVSNNSTLRCLPCTITGNASDGVRLQKKSEATFDAFNGPNSITGNGGSGVTLLDLSFASFDFGNMVTGNSSGTDVVCNQQFSATRGALANIGGGTTNCTEP